MEVLPTADEEKTTTLELVERGGSINILLEAVDVGTIRYRVLTEDTIGRALLAEDVSDEEVEREEETLEVVEGLLAGDLKCVDAMFVAGLRRLLIVATLSSVLEGTVVRLVPAEGYTLLLAIKVVVCAPVTEAPFNIKCPTFNFTEVALPVALVFC